MLTARLSSGREIKLSAQCVYDCTRGFKDSICPNESTEEWINDPKVKAQFDLIDEYELMANNNIVVTIPVAEQRSWDIEKLKRVTLLVLCLTVQYAAEKEIAKRDARKRRVNKVVKVLSFITCMIWIVINASSMIYALLFPVNLCFGTVELTAPYWLGLAAAIDIVAMSFFILRNHREHDLFITKFLK